MTGFPLILGHVDVDLPIAPYGAVLSALAASLGVVFAFLAWRARSRGGHKRLLWIAGAFTLFAAKNAFSAASVMTEIVPHDMIELVLSGCDVVLMVLMFLPFLTVRRRPGGSRRKDHET